MWAKNPKVFWDVSKKTFWKITPQNPVLHTPQWRFCHSTMVAPIYIYPTSSIFETVMIYDCPAIDSTAVTSSGPQAETNAVWTSMKGTDDSWCIFFPSHSRGSSLFVSLCRFSRHALVNVDSHIQKKLNRRKKNKTNKQQGLRSPCWPNLGVLYCSGHKATRPPQSDLSFFLQPPMGTLLTTAEPTALTPPATALTPPFTSPTPTPGTAATVLTALLVRSRLLPPTQAAPPIVIPTAPLVTPYKPPASLPNTPGCVWGWSLLLSEHMKSRMSDCRRRENQQLKAEVKV